MQEKSKTKKEITWVEFLSSTRLAIYTLIALTGACVMGIFLPQKFVTLTVADYLNLIQKPFWNFLDRLGFLNIFESIWFGALVALMVVNLLFCTYQGMKRVGKRLKNDRRPITEKRARNRLFFRVWKSGKVSTSDAEQAMAHLGRTKIETDGEGSVIKVEKGVLTLFAPLFIHTAIILIVAGAMIDVFGGYDGMMNIVEGSKRNVFVSINSKAQQVKFELPFEIRCDKFDLEYYPGAGKRPKDYKSHLTVIDNGKEVMTKTIEVNVPLVYKGLKFFQSSYGTAGQMLTFDVTRQADGKTKMITLVPGKMRNIPEFANAFQTESGQMVPPLDWAQVLDVVDDYQGNGPAAQIGISKGGESQKGFAVFQHAPDYDLSRKGAYKFVLKNMETVMWTGLQVVYKPGATLIWIGCILFMLANVYGFVVPYRWAQARIEKDSLVITGVSKGSQEPWFDKMDEAAAKVTQKIGKPKDKGQA